MEQALCLGALFERYYPKLKNRVIDSIYSALNAFGFEHVVSQLRPHFEVATTSYIEQSDNASLLGFLEDFWFVDPAYTLLQLQQAINELEQDKSSPTEVVLDHDDNNVRVEGIVKVLAAFSRATVDDASIALELLCDYVEKQPSESSRCCAYLRGLRVSA